MSSAAAAAVLAFACAPHAADAAAVAQASTRPPGADETPSIPAVAPTPPVEPVQPTSAAPAAAPPPERLNTTGRNIPLMAPLQDGAFVLGEIDFVIRADDTITIDAARLLALLAPIIDPARYEVLKASLAGLNEVPITKIGEFGYVITYDPATISLKIAIPAGDRTTRQIQLTDLDETIVGTVDPPANFAGYINLRSSFDYAWRGSDRGIQDPLVLLDSAFWYRNVVLENEGSVQIGTGSQGDTQIRREGTRFVYDDRQRLVRWTAGDLQPVSRGFSGAPQLAGLSVVRNYSVLEPQRNIQPRGERTFTIVRPSVVEAYINGQQIRELRLQPGTYNVRDFPFAQGSNDVRLVVTDDAGRQEVIEFSLFFDRTLLAKGLSEFGLYAGVRSRFSGSGRNYDGNQPGASGYFRTGLTDRLTVGANFQAQKRGGVLGGEAVVATALGTLGGDLAISNVSGIGTGYALNVSLQRSFGGIGSAGRAFGVAFERRSKNFATPSDRAADNRFAYEVTGTYSQALGELQFFSLTAGYSKGRFGFSDEKTARATYGYRLSPRINLALESIYEDRQVRRRNYGLRATLTYRFSTRSTATAEYDSRDDRARVGFQTSSGDGVGAISASGDATYSSGAVGGDASVSYTANRADIGVSHTSVFNVRGDSIADQRTSFRLGTAIAFADGSIALSRPIFDSFAMIKAHSSIAGKTVYVNRSDKSYTAKSGIFGPAVEPDLSSYSERVVTYDVPDAPIGYDLGAGAARVFPPYRSGYLITAGSAYSVTALGYMFNENGEPVSLLAGTATELAAPGRPPIDIFTTRSGRFGIQGLRPGKWRIDMPTQPSSSVIITVPESSTGLVQLGDVKLGAR